MSDKSKKNMNNKPTEWSDFSIRNNSLLEDVSTWSPKDFIGYIRSVYYQKYLY